MIGRPIRAARERWSLRALVLIVAGGGAGLGQAPWGLWPLTMIVLAAFLALHRAETRPWRAAWQGWAFGTGYFGCTLHWIVQPFLVDPERYGWMAPFALVFMAAGMALFWGAAAGLATRVAPGRVLGAVSALALAELARSLVLTGFPWALVGHIWIGTPLAQTAAWIGPHGLTLATLLLSAGLIAGPLALRGAPVLAVAAAWVLLDPGPMPPPAADAPMVRMIQPNATQTIKWAPGMAQVFFDRQLGLSRPDVAGLPPPAPPDLIVWPETALQWPLESAALAVAEMARAARGAPIVTGVLRRDDTRWYNSLIVVGSRGEVAARYDKAHLVPFGEYLPFGDLAARFGLRGLAASEGGGFTAGDGPALIDIPGIGPALPLICYEGIFAEEVNAAGGRARLMVLITNDGWFGTWAGPEQHFALARLRAIEQGLPLVRVANTGISGMIDGQGRVAGRMELDTMGALDLPLPPALPPTIYVRWGDWPAIAALVLLTLAVAAASFHVDRLRRTD